MKNLSINPASTELVNKFINLYPFDVEKKDNVFEIEISHDRREIWAFPLISGTDYIDNSIHLVEEHRKVIPAALNRCKSAIDGVFLVGYFIKKINEKELEHGLVVIPANRESKKANEELLTSYCFEREILYKSMMSERYFEQIQLFLKSYSSICKKYWIQDTKLMNTEFVERPTSNSDKTDIQEPAISNWHTEVYPDFMRPLSMIGDIYIDFMICDNQLVYLNNDFDENDSIWELFEEEKIKEIISMPSKLTQNILPIDNNNNYETTGFELSSRKDFNNNFVYDIAVPALKGNILDFGYSLGWCGKISFMGLGLDKPLFISPDLLKEIDEILDFDKVSNDNKAYWRNRDIDYRKKVKTHNLVKISDNLLPVSEVKYKLIAAAEVVLQSCKKPLKEVQKGINKFVIRYLKGLSRGENEKEANEFLNQINNVKINADEQEILLKIIDWAKELGSNSSDFGVISNA